MDQSPWIGPTKCDEKRNAREADINEVWQELISSESFIRTHTVLQEAIDLFRESISCYQNGAFMAAVLMCRSASEAALYCSVTREPTKYFEGSGTIAAWNIKPLSDDEFATILQEAKAKYNIDGKLEQVITYIRYKGNFVAHYVSRLDKQDFDQMQIEGTWITREQTLDVLRKTIIVIKHLYEQIGSS